MDGMPKANEHHQKLQAFAGQWTGNEILYPSPWSPTRREATAQVTSRMDLDGFTLITDYVEEQNGQVTYRGHGVFGWDEPKKQYYLFWFDSMGFGEAIPAHGQWEGDTLSFQNQSPMGHGRYVYRAIGPNEYSFRLESSKNGKEWATFMEGKYNRV